MTKVYGRPDVTGRCPDGRPTMKFPYKCRTTGRDDSMKVRHPQFDFSAMTAHWAPNHEWAHNMNSSGIIPSAIEPFLIKVMRRAKTALDPVADAELIADIDIFNRQESQQYRIHEDFNQMVIDSGYPELARFDDDLKAEYAEFLKTKSLVWLLGYCEGFESLAGSGSSNWVDNGWGSYLEGAHPQAVAMWRWHLAEEYEHRTVVHRAFLRFAKGTPDEIYNFRIELFTFCVGHMRAHTAALRRYLIDTDRASMTDAERTESEQREAAVDEALAGQQPLIAGVLEKNYDPIDIPAPKLLDEVLARY